jgi:MFS transporter, DHA1 family, tetracycline resistance protein
LENQASSLPEKLWTRETFAVLFVSTFGYFLAGIIEPIRPLFLKDLGFDVSTIGILSAIMLAGWAVSDLTWGWIVDRVDLRTAIYTGTIAAGIVIASLAFVKSFFAVAAVFFLLGLTRSPISIMGRWYMGVYAPKHQRAMAMAILSSTIGLFSSAAGFVSGYISDAFGYSSLFFLSAGLGLGTGLIILILGKRLNFQKHKQTSTQTEQQNQEPKIVTRKAKMTVFGLGLIGVMVFIMWGISGTFLPLFGTEAVGLSASQIGVLFGIRGLISTAMMIPLGRMGDKGDKWTFLSIGMGVAGLSMLGTAFSGQYSWLLFFIIIGALGSAIYNPTITAVLSQSVPVFWVGTAMGIFGFLEDVGWMIGPVIGGLLWDGWSMQAPYIFAAGIAFLTIPLVLFIKSKVAPKAG